MVRKLILVQIYVNYKFIRIKLKSKSCFEGLNSGTSNLRFHYSDPQNLKV